MVHGIFSVGPNGNPIPSILLRAFWGLQAIARTSKHVGFAMSFLQRFRTPRGPGRARPSRGSSRPVVSGWFPVKRWGIGVAYLGAPRFGKDYKWYILRVSPTHYASEIKICSFSWRAPYKPSTNSTVSGPGIPPRYILPIGGLYATDPTFQKGTKNQPLIGGFHPGMNRPKYPLYMAENKWVFTGALYPAFPVTDPWEW